MADTTGLEPARGTRPPPRFQRGAIATRRRIQIMDGMGGPMSYQRMRERNNLMHRKPADDPDPYFRVPEHMRGREGAAILIGDLNRMERDYLSPDGDLVLAAAEATGVDANTVTRVMRYVFFEQT